MPRSATSAIALLLALLLAVALASCGEEDADLLAGETAREITANLDAVEQLADEGDCVGAESAAEQVSEQVEALEGVDPRLKRALREGAARLNEVVGECEEEDEAVAPATVPPEAEEAEEAGGDGKGRNKKEKDEDKEERPARPQPGSEGGGGPDDEGGGPPPQAKGEGGGGAEGDGEAESGEDSEDPSGGVSPGTAVDEGD